MRPPPDVRVLAAGLRRANPPEGGEGFVLRAMIAGSQLNISRRDALEAAACGPDDDIADAACALLDELDERGQR